jgi:hypothetical protein
VIDSEAANGKGKSMSQESNEEELTPLAAPHFLTGDDQAGLAAWTELEDGRFMPRRVRGSCQGRALG